MARRVRSPTGVRLFVILLIGLSALGASPVAADENHDRGSSKHADHADIAAPPPEPTPPPAAPVSPRAQLPSAQARPTATDAPTVEPIAEVIDVANDPNARSAMTPGVPNAAAAATQSATATPTGAPSPTAEPPSDSELVNGVMAGTMEPLAAGGRLGLIGGGLVAIGFVGIQRLRRRR